jgi:hypothetical protein
LIFHLETGLKVCGGGGWVGGGGGGGVETKFSVLLQAKLKF